METYRIKIAKQTVERKADDELKALKPSGEYKATDWRVLGVPFGGHLEGRDSDGETFTADTEISLKFGDTRPITYYHGFGVEQGDAVQNPPAILGEATYTGKDARGHWFTVKLDEQEPLARRLLEAGAESVKASSGAVSHLVRVTTAGIITNWPVGELALFDTNEWRQPANQLAVVELAGGFEVTQSMAKAGEADLLAGDEIESEQTKNQTIRELMEGSKMENEKELVEETIDEKETEQAQPEQPKQDSALLDEVKALRKEISELKKSAPAQFKAKPHQGMSDDEQVHEFIKSIRTGKASIAEQHTTANTTLVNVPRSTYDKINKKVQEMALFPRLGIQRVISDKHITSGGLSEFVLAAEAAAFDLDRMTAHKEVDFSKVKYTKTVEMTYETLDRSDGEIEDWIVNAVADAWVRTADKLLWTAISGGGTLLGTFASATAISGGDLEKVVYADSVDKYLDNSPSVSLLMKRSTLGAVESVYAAGRAYDNQRPFLGERVYTHSGVPAIAANAKSIWFGNWREAIGYRDFGQLNLIRDPYSKARNGVLCLHYHTFGVFKVINGAAYGCGQHPAS